MNRFKIWLFNKATDYLFPMLTINRVLTASKSGHLFLNGELVTEKQKGELQAAARMFRNTILWEIINDTVTAQAQEKMFKEATSNFDVANAKIMLYTLEVQRNILKKIEEAK